jgi:hypothetical protein
LDHVTVFADERANAVFVSGPRGKINAANAIVEGLDVRPPTQALNPVISEMPIWREYRVQRGTADAVVETLKEIYRASPIIRVRVSGNDRFMFYGPPADHMDLRPLSQGGALIKDLNLPSTIRAED